MQPCSDSSPEIKRMISFDIGIKNMAYCLFEFSPSPLRSNESLNIIEWKNINLLAEEEEEEEKNSNCTTNEASTLSCCTHILKNGKQCSKLAKFVVNINTLLCKSHAKSLSEEQEYLMPNKKYLLASLNKMKLTELLELVDKYITNNNSHNNILNNIFGDSSKRNDASTSEKHNLTDSSEDPFSIACEEGKSKPKKSVYVQLLHTFFQKRMLQPIDSSFEKQTRNAKNTSIVTICQNMNRHFLKEFRNMKIDIVLIENQISNIASRMFMIQGMVLQFFLLQNQETKVEFISSRNKLKDFTSETESMVIVSEEMNERMKYKKHKNDGIMYCAQLLKTNCDSSPSNRKWLHFFENLSNRVKKDDLADCFLQGMWFIQHKV